jgi:lipoprotein-releasing system ATP-binding protein
MECKNTILTAKSLSKYFYEPETFQVIKDISFEVNKGEFLSIMGKSGSGKSTLLYLLSTMDTDFSGELVINGVDLTSKDQNQLASFRNDNIGFVFQFHFLLPDFTALENVMLPALKQGKKSREEVREKAYELLKRFDLQDRAYNKAGKLSGGQQQRVAVARALINDPVIIMGDEPTGNLDSNNSNIVFDIFRELAKEKGQTIIAVTHDDDFAANCDRILELEDGSIVRQF